MTRNPAAQPGPRLHAQGCLRARPCAGSLSGVTAAVKLALCCPRALLAPGAERNASIADPAPRFRSRAPPSAPPPSSHRAPFEQASLEPLPLANGKRWLRKRARRRVGLAQDERRTPFSVRRSKEILQVGPSSCHKGGVTSRAPGEALLAWPRRPPSASASSAKASVFPSICGEAFVPTLSSGAALTQPSRDMFADVPPRPPSRPCFLARLKRCLRNSRSSSIGCEGHFAETFSRAGAGTESQGPDGPLGLPCLFRGAEWVQLSFPHDNISF